MVDELKFLTTLEQVISERLDSADEQSYTAQLARAGVLTVAQKLGEESIETALAAVAQSRERVRAEAADLVYHLLVLLALKEIRLAEVVAELETRHRR